MKVNIACASYLNEDRFAAQQILELYLQGMSNAFYKPVLLCSLRMGSSLAIPTHMIIGKKKRKNQIGKSIRKVYYGRGQNYHS